MINSRKMPSKITEILVNQATFKNNPAKITPTYINYFFGSNGTGKSTVAKTIRSGKGVTFATGTTTEDKKIMLYDQDYIERNVRSNENLPGVYTINSTNAEIQENINELKKKKETLDEKRTNAIEDRDRHEQKLEQLNNQFYSNCWDKTEAIRKTFVKTQKGFKASKKKFVDKLLETAPLSQDTQKLKDLYDTAYAEDAKQYPKFNESIDPSILDKVQDNEILSIAIVNSADTQLASFFKQIGATEWVQQGHSEFQKKTNGRCPYCSRELEPSFEQEFQRSFDDQYEHNRQRLRLFLENYRKTANNLFSSIRKIPEPLYPTIERQNYNDKLNAIKGVITGNIEKIRSKIEEPSKIVELNGLKAMLTDLQGMITGFNSLIDENNTIVASKSVKKQECKEAVFALMAFDMKELIANYQQAKEQIDDEIKAQETKIKESYTSLTSINEQIVELNQQTVETETAMNNINTMLQDSGFQGFKLRPAKALSDDKKAPTINYEVVRTETGTVAKNLSEGERNFIAFMYFLQQVYGSDNKNGNLKDKIVIIDDPVSSMDSSTLFIVSAEIRKLVSICRNNADNRRNLTDDNFIKQIFIFTHNAFFQREVSYEYENEYNYVSFYLISKKNNQSDVKLCEKQNPNCPTHMMNVNPVKNSYATLWEEYQQASGAVLINVMRRILEYYFLQICGHSRASLRKQILEDNRDKFIQDGFQNYNLASAILSYITDESMGITDDVLFVETDVNDDQCRKTFELIFQCMGQEQHFNMMMNK